jgi:hypothetical protein
VSEGFVQFAGLLLKDSNIYFDTGGSEFFYAATADERVGIGSGDHGARDAGGDQSVGAGSGAAVVAAGLEGDVSGGARDGEAAGGGLLEGDDLGVVVEVVEMCALG